LRCTNNDKRALAFTSTDFNSKISLRRWLTVSTKKMFQGRMLFLFKPFQHLTSLPSSIIIINPKNRSMCQSYARRLQQENNKGIKETKMTRPCAKAMLGV
jgi:hypothetical protein